MKIPETINIAGKCYRVVQEAAPFADGCDVCDGAINLNRADIRINTDMDSQRVRQVLLHEAFHGICNTFGIRAPEEDVDRLSHAVFQLWKDNPGLFKED